MNAAFNQIREQLQVAWMGRTEQERKFLGVGACVLLLALVYALLVAPALNGRAQLTKSLPELRQQAAQLQALAQEAAELARQPAAAPPSMTRDALAASLAARSLTAQTLAVTGEYAKLQLNGVAFSSLVGWLDAERRDARITAVEAAIVAQKDAGMVDATLTLRQLGSEGGK
ncbi:MAG: type II secretion system protein GspM [Pseudomonadota bacterium]